MQGVSLSPSLKGEELPDRAFYFESVFAKEVLGCAPVIGILKNDHKFIDLPRSELYHLASDPAEKINLAASKKSFATRMKIDLKDLIRKISANNVSKQRSLSVSERAKLASLGYITAAQSESKQTGINEDPKDMIDAFSQYNQANILFSQKRIDEAKTGYQESIRLNPRFAPAYAKLAGIYSQRGNLGSASTILGQGMTAVPGDIGLKIDFANLLIKSKKNTEAIELLSLIEENCSPDLKVKVHLQLAQVNTTIGNHDSALKFYNQALKIEPLNLNIIKKKLAIFLSLKRFSKALDLYHLIEKQQPANGDILQGIATLYGQTGNFERAQHYFQKAFSLPHKPFLYFNHAIILSMQKEYARALLSLEKFMSLITRNHPLYNNARKLIEDFKAYLKSQTAIQ